jgi:hypothetical protein
MKLVLKKNLYRLDQLYRHLQLCISATNYQYFFWELLAPGRPEGRGSGRAQSRQMRHCSAKKKSRKKSCRNI